MKRQAKISRVTLETSVTVELDLDREGTTETSTGVPFLDHLLQQLGKHASVDLKVWGEGDLELDAHHLVEDIGIVLGQALKQGLGDRRGINRYGQAILPMDECLVLVAVDLSGRGYLSFEAEWGTERIGSFDPRLLTEFFRAMVFHAGITLHLKVLQGGNAHHLAEAFFKAFARALGMALAPGGLGIPSTKGLL